MLTPTEKLLRELMAERILILDGAMGTMVQRYKLEEADYRGTQFADWPSDVKGNNDLLCITKPEVIREIHSQYIEAGADIIETNTFSGTTIAMADYGMEALVPELNRAAAKVAREAADACTDRRIFVGGSHRTAQSHAQYFPRRQRSRRTRCQFRAGGQSLSRTD